MCWTLHFLIMHFKWMLWQCCTCVLGRFRHKSHTVGKTSCFYPDAFVATTQKEMSRCLVMNIQFCCHKHSWKLYRHLVKSACFLGHRHNWKMSQRLIKIIRICQHKRGLKNMPTSLQNYLINCHKRDSKIAWLLGKKAVLSSQIKLGILPTSHQKYPQCPDVS